MGANATVVPVSVTLALYVLAGALSYAWEPRALRALILTWGMSGIGISAATWYASRQITICFGFDGPLSLATAYVLWVVALGTATASVGWMGWWAARLTRR
jgi:hypothetical protein